MKEHEANSSSESLRNLYLMPAEWLQKTKDTVNLTFDSTDFSNKIEHMVA